jgi:hypothetical protein
MVEVTTIAGSWMILYAENISAIPTKLHARTARYIGNGSDFGIVVHLYHARDGCPGIDHESLLSSSLPKKE